MAAEQPKCIAGPSGSLPPVIFPDDWVAVVVVDVHGHGRLQSSVQNGRTAAVVLGQIADALAAQFGLDEKRKG